MLEMHFVDKNANVDSKLHSYLFLLENYNLVPGNN